MTEREREKGEGEGGRERERGTDRQTDRQTEADRQTDRLISQLESLIWHQNIRPGSEVCFPLLQDFLANLIQVSLRAYTGCRQRT